MKNVEKSRKKYLLKLFARKRIASLGFLGLLAALFLPFTLARFEMVRYTPLPNGGNRKNAGSNESKWIS